MWDASSLEQLWDASSLEQLWDASSLEQAVFSCFLLKLKSVTYMKKQRVGWGGRVHPRGKLGGGVSQWSDTCTKPQWKDQGLHQLLTRWELWGDF